MSDIGNILRQADDKTKTCNTNILLWKSLCMCMPHSQDHTNFRCHAPEGNLKLKDLRCTFGYAAGMRYPHFAKFDVRPEACKKLADFVPGDIVECGAGSRTTAKRTNAWSVQEK